MKKEDYLRKIYNNPEDIQLRMEFADYLIKEGNPVGNAIRLQCEADFTSSDEERFPLTRRSQRNSKRALFFMVPTVHRSGSDRHWVLARDTSFSAHQCTQLCQEWRQDLCSGSVD